jgi:hypothetical protein
MDGEVPVRRADHGHEDPAVVGRVDHRAAGEVRAGVQLVVVQDRVEPHPERRGDDAVQRVREGAGALHRVALTGQPLGERVDLGAELARLRDPRLVEGDVAAARGLHGPQGGRALRGQPGQAAVRVGQGPLGDLVAGGDRLELGAHLLLPTTRVPCRSSARVALSSTSRCVGAAVSGASESRRACHAAATCSAPATS